MNGHGIVRLSSLIVACMLLAACTGSGVRDGEWGQESGGSGKESPGALYVELAREYLRQGQVEPALLNANKALKEDADNAQAHVVLALIHRGLGQNETAEQHFRKATSLEPKDPYVLNAYGSYLCDRRKFAEAETQYKKALANPLFQTPWVTMTNMGTCAKRSGNNAKAETYFDQALKASPRFGPALVAMAELDYSRSRYKSARTYFDRYIKAAQPTPRALLLAVRVERKLGARKRADTYAQMLRKSYPDSYEALQLKKL